MRLAAAAHESVLSHLSDTKTVQWNVRFGSRSLQ
jgi:hypothetical protein